METKRWKPNSASDLKEDFYFKTRIFHADNGCIEWKGSKSWAGYGIMYINGKRVLATRWLMSKIIGRELDKMELCCHKCDNPSYVNADHIFIGSQKDNMVDASRKGRTRAQLPQYRESVLKTARENGAKAAITQSGCDNVNCKLSYEDVETIIFMLASGHNRKRIATIFNVSVAVIGWIKQQRSYRREISEIVFKNNISVKEIKTAKNKRIEYFFRTKREAQAKLRQIKNILKER